MLASRSAHDSARARWLWLLQLGALLLGCGPDGGGDRRPGRAEEEADAADVVSEQDAGNDLDGGEASSDPDAAAERTRERAALCDRPADDAVRDIFCKGENRSVTGLRELLRQLDLPPLPPDMDEESAAAIPFEPDQVSEDLVLLGHSTALSGQLVSAINPRAILIGKNTLVAYQRGVQKVEIATRDRAVDRQNFYLVTFGQDCNERKGGCLPGDLYTPEVERDWRTVRLRDDEDLKNTPLDCRQCHQRKQEKLTLLMRELFGPWPHFFFLDVPGLTPTEQLGEQLMRDYLSAKGSESYAGMPSAQLRRTVGATLQRVIRTPQTLTFDPRISLDLDSKIALGLPRRSSIWDAQYESFKRGEQLALPYFEQSAADPEKLRRMAAAYARYRSGELSREELPDLGDVYPDDPQTRAEIGLQTEPGAPPVDALIQACGQCHNDVLDQTISRARFNVALGRMTQRELDIAIERIELPADSEAAMPPKGMRQLDAGGKQRLIEYLRANVRSAEDDGRLEHAARHGMATPKYSYIGI